MCPNFLGLRSGSARPRCPIGRESRVSRRGPQSRRGNQSPGGCFRNQLFASRDRRQKPWARAVQSTKRRHVGNAPPAQQFGCAHGHVVAATTTRTLDSSRTEQIEERQHELGSSARLLARIYAGRPLESDLGLTERMLGTRGPSWDPCWSPVG